MSADDRSGAPDTHVGIGYTLATGRLFCPMADFHAWAEKQLSRPIMTHEFAMHDTWDELRESFEHDVKEAFGAVN